LILVGFGRICWCRGARPEEKPFLLALVLDGICGDTDEEITARKASLPKWRLKARRRWLDVSMIRKSGCRFFLATNAERVCAEIMLKQKDRAG